MSNYICHKKWVVDDNNAGLSKLFREDNMSCYARRDRAIVALTMAGFTPEHIRMMRMRHVEQRGNVLHLRGVKLPLSIARLLVEYIAERRHKPSPGLDNWLFLSSISDQFSRKGLFDFLRKYGFQPEVLE